MNALVVATNYFLWHYTRGFKDLFHVWWNVIWFIQHLFSVPILLRTFIAPWKRLDEEKGSLLKDPESFFSGLAVNILMRLVGMIVRTMILVVAFICFLISNIIGILMTIFWLITPIAIPTLIFIGIMLILSYV